MLVVCERWVGDGDRLLHIDPSSSDHSSTSSSSWLGLLNRGSLRAQTPLSGAGSQFGIFTPTDSNSNWFKPSVSWLYFCLTSTCFRCSSAYLHGCIPWLMARSRVNMLQILLEESHPAKDQMITFQSPSCVNTRWVIRWKDSISDFFFVLERSSKNKLWSLPGAMQTILKPLLNTDFSMQFRILGSINLCIWKKE